MGWFSFLKKIQTKKEYDLSFFPIFSELSGAELNLIQTKVRLVQFKKGEVVYRKGEESGDFYLILRGRVVILRDNREVVNHLHAGDHFGETSLLINKPHSATVEAINESLVLRIQKNEFLSLLKDIPSLSLNISRTLGLRLTGSLDERVLSGAFKIMSFYHSTPGIGNSTFALHLACSISQETQKKVILLDFSSLSDESSQNSMFQKIKPFSLDQFNTNNTQNIESFVVKNKTPFDVLKLSNENPDQNYEKELAQFISYLLAQYQYILIDLPVVMNSLVRRAMQQSDIIYFLVDENDRGIKDMPVKVREFKSSFGFTDDQIRLILRERSAEPARTLFYDEFSESALPIFAILPDVGEFQAQPLVDFGCYQELDRTHRFARTTRYLAREVSGKLVGLALGSGAAFGYAHVGVLKVLEEEGIDIDIISASSIGAIMGGMWAAGISSDKLLNILDELNPRTTFFKLFGFRDLSAPHMGFFKGNQIVRFLKQYLEGVTFRDLNVVTKIIATDLSTGAPILFDDGPIVDAIHASIAIPGIFRPAKVHGKYLIDGGISEPLPVQILNRFGANKIIAVNVLQSPDDHYRRMIRIEEKNDKQEDMLQGSNPLVRSFHSFRRKFVNHESANIFNVLMKTIQFMEYGMADAASKQADVTLNPVVTDAHWAEFYSYRKFIRRGEEEARRHMDEIKSLVNDQI